MRCGFVRELPSCTISQSVEELKRDKNPSFLQQECMKSSSLFSPSTLRSENKIYLFYEKLSLQF